MNYFDAKDFNIKLDEMLDKFPKVHKTSIYEIIQIRPSPEGLALPMTTANKIAIFRIATIPPLDGCPPPPIHPTESTPKPLMCNL